MWWEIRTDLMKSQSTLIHADEDWLSEPEINSHLITPHMHKLPLKNSSSNWSTLCQHWSFFSLLAMKEFKSLCHCCVDGETHWQLMLCFVCPQISDLMYTLCFNELHHIHQLYTVCLNNLNRTSSNVSINIHCLFLTSDQWWRWRSNTQCHSLY